MTTHQSRTMVWPYERVPRGGPEPADARPRSTIPPRRPVPPYYPDTPVVRQTIARYYDCVTAMDKNVGRILAELEEDGLADDTIVFFYSDHGAGLPRHKRVLHDSGMHVPAAGPLSRRSTGTSRRPRRARRVDRLVSFVDFAPTVLSLLGLAIPDAMQGSRLPRARSRPSRGSTSSAPGTGSTRPSTWRARSGTSEYLYIRNYMPHLVLQPAQRLLGHRGRSARRSSVWPSQDRLDRAAARLRRRRADLGRSSTPCGDDPHQVAQSGLPDEHQEALERMRQELTRWIRATHDVGFLPEAEAWARIGDRTPYEIARDAEAYPQAANHRCGRPRRSRGRPRGADRAPAGPRCRGPLLGGGRPGASSRLLRRGPGGPPRRAVRPLGGRRIASAAALARHARRR